MSHYLATSDQSVLLTRPRSALADPAAPALGARAPFRSRSEAGPLNLPTVLEGTFPPWLRGDLIRTAPAVFDRAPTPLGAFRAEHWFDGLGLLYAFRIESGGVSYRQRLMASEAEQQAQEGKMAMSSFGSPAVRSLWQRMLSPLPVFPDNTNVNALPFGRELVALTESSRQWAFDRASLQLTKRVAYEDELGDLTMTAHPHFDFARRRIVNVATKFGRENAIIVYEHSEGSRARRVIGRIKVARVPYLHSFGLTPRHAIVIGQPFDVNPLSMLWSNRGFIDHFRYRPEQGMKLWLIDRDTGKVRTHTAPSGFTFHVANAFEDAERTVLDLLLYPDASIVAALERGALLEHGLPALAPALTRITMTPGREAATSESLLAEGFEFPSLNYRRKSGQRHALTFGTRITPTGSEGRLRSTIVRLQENGHSLEHSEPDVIFGEPVFVAQPASEGEDAGVLLTVGTHAQRDSAELRVLDARTLALVARASVALPIPLGFHGSFFAA